MYACKFANKLRYTTFGYKFTIPVIKWHLVNVTTDMGGTDVIEAFRLAFNEWNRVLFPIRLESTSNINEANITINFAVDGDPELPEPFGDKSVLAYAYFPVDNETSMWFDDSENWAKMGGPGYVELYAVALHEIGHALGLGHTDQEMDIMYPYYDPNIPLGISQDSIDGILKLYSDLMDSIDPEVDLPDIPEFPDIPEIPDDKEEKSKIIKLILFSLLLIIIGIYLI